MRVVEKIATEDLHAELQVANALTNSVPPIGKGRDAREDNLHVAYPDDVADLVMQRLQSRGSATSRADEVIDHDDCTDSIALLEVASQRTAFDDVDRSHPRFLCEQPSKLCAALRWPIEVAHEDLAIGLEQRGG